MKKIYLETAEEICKALSEGKVVYQAHLISPLTNEWREKFKSFYLCNGLLISELCAYKRKHIGTEISLDNSYYKYYYEEC